MARAIAAFVAQHILEALQSRGSGVNLIVLDACRDNPLPARLSERSGNVERGLIAMNLAESTNLQFLYSAGPNERALDGQGTNSPFTLAFVEALRIPGLTWEALVKATARAVKRSEPKATLPYWEGRLVDDVVLNLSHPAGALSASRENPGPRVAGATNLNPQSRRGVSLGGIEALSSLGEPLRARVLLTGSPQNLHVTDADHSDYKRLGISCDKIPSDLVVQSRTSGAETDIWITTNQPVTDAFLTILIAVSWTEGYMLREYTLLLDAPRSRKELNTDRVLFKGER